MPRNGHKARILLFDIETTPSLGYVWGKYQQDVIQFHSEWEMLCFAYKWLGDDLVYADARNGLDERALVKKLWKLFDKADIIIAHNGNSFDIKMVNAKFAEFGLTPPSYYKTIDTKLVAKRYFRFLSNKLDDLGQKLGVGEKLSTGGFELWLGCMAGNREAWEKMIAYNIQDVLLLEKVYLKLLPWIDNHPGINILEGRPEACPKCGKGPMQRRGTVKTTKVGILQRYQCQSCGGWSQSRRSQRSDVKYVN